MTQTLLNVAVLRKRLERHPCLTTESNPVLTAALSDGCAAEAVATALGQYCFLPRRIAELLSLGASRIGRSWPKVTQELRRNVQEEMGAKTFGQSHFHILKTCVEVELGLELDQVVEGPASTSFLAELADWLRKSPRPKAAGVVAALEDSATPELKIVARVINRFAELAGLGRVPIDLAIFASRDHLEAIWRRARRGFTLEDFLALHVLYFEAGHSEGLAKAIGPYLTTPSDFDQFLASYESTLDSMDRWWEAMAIEAGMK